ncbi:MAG: phosphoenolpyruvate carboxykinase (ATP) [Alphaproteobacteria bacterium]|nr:phosphoenolpyruvate carboxykinase (ATP) [Alphaproteobacteria bacterium]
MHGTNGTAGLEKHISSLGIGSPSAIRHNLSPAALYEMAIKRGEVQLSEDGPLIAMTGQHTGRSPNDKYVVRDSQTAKDINFGNVNQPYEPAAFDALKKRAVEWLKGRELFVQDLYAGADPAHRMPLRVITTNAWHALFVRNMFIRPTAEQLKSFEPKFTLLHAPDFLADPAVDQTKSGTFIMINFGQSMAMIGGTSYAGEMKKTIFSVMNYYLPQKGVFPMHASANIGQGGDVAIFFGLSGTGKTTLSADSSRTLIGDDEHGWSDNAVFNFEGGCYAKAIRLNPKQEPEIYGAARRFGTVLENVAFDPVTRKVDFDDEKNTENTRACYPVDFIPNASETGVGGLPRNVIMLTCDAYGVLPPVSKLSPEQAMYQFLSGYTAKVAGTEKGITEPQATFSACFGRPFLPLAPEAYAKMLGEKIAKHKVDCWLINTGWTGGGYGVGERIPINVSRAIVNAALSGDLAKGKFVRNEPFGLMIPVKVNGVSDDVLHPRKMWKDTAAYDETAKKLIEHFAENFKKFADKVAPEVIKGALGV